MDLHGVHIPRLRQSVTAVLGALMVLSLVVMPARADHVWGSYHLSRSSTTQVLEVGVNLTTTVWKDHLTTAISQWNAPHVITLKAAPGKTTPKQCKPSAGTIQVCNATYGNTGWLGIAQIWISSGHISQGTAKQNDTYFNKASYNTPAWRQMVICQEVAHTFGLGHVNETHSDVNTGSCMDYTNAPAGGIVNGVDYGPANTAPNQHDYDLLTQITHYPQHHTTTTTTTPTDRARAEEEVTGLDPKGWGRVTERDEKGRPVHYERELGPDLKVVTFVIPVDEPGEATGNSGTGTGEGTVDNGGHAHGGHAHGNDQGKQADSTQDRGKKQDADGKRDGKKADGKRDGGAKAKKDQGKKADSKRDGKRGR